MIPTRLIRRAILSWQSYRTRRRLYAHYPELRHLDEAEREARRQHGQTAHIHEAKKALMLSALRGERA